MPAALEQLKPLHRFRGVAVILSILIDVVDHLHGPVPPDVDHPPAVAEGVLDDVPYAELDLGDGRGERSAGEGVLWRERRAGEGVFLFRTELPYKNNE